MKRCLNRCLEVSRRDMLLNGFVCWKIHNEIYSHGNKETHYNYWFAKSSISPLAKRSGSHSNMVNNYIQRILGSIKNSTFSNQRIGITSGWRPILDSLSHAAINSGLESREYGHGFDPYASYWQLIVKTMVRPYHNSCCDTLSLRLDVMVWFALSLR